ncbi:alpha-L-arabinofuranosidase [Aureococcus anophagefferens]|nr:alpha-L-arabinofuranosidase [Aureococcus anophagefferens]
MVFLQVGSLFALAGVVRAANEGPCDIFEAAATPCVAAHSTVRALYAAYAGPLYEVRRADDNATFDVMARAGVADAEAQDDFCGASDCVVSKIFDHVYSLYFEGGMGYRNDNTSGVAVGDEPETIYMVASGRRAARHYNDKCCFDYGNAETDDNDEGAGTMEAVYFGNANGGLNHGGAGDGRRPEFREISAGRAPFGDATLGRSDGPTSPPSTTTSSRPWSRATPAPPGHWAIKGGDATSGGLATGTARAPGYAPMKKQGALLLGVGGDNSNRAVGTFYEGAVVSHYTTDATDAAVQANIVAAGYGK